MIAVFSEDTNEIKLLMQKVEILSHQSWGKTTIYIASLNNVQFLIVESGYAKVNLGVAAGLACNAYKVDKIIGMGDCGCLRSRGAKPGNVAVAQTSRQYDVDFSPLGYQPSLIVGLSSPQYPCNAELVALAQKEAKALNIPYITANFGSADRFLANGDDFYQLSQEFGFDCVDTETAAIGEFAFINSIPYVYVKGISNYGDDNAAEMYEHYRTAAYERACHVVYHMLNTLTGGGQGGGCSGGDKMSLDVNITNYTQLTTAECLTQINATKLALLSVAENGQPYAVPMAFAIKAAPRSLSFCLYSKAAGKKMQCMAANSKVCLTFVHETTDGFYSMVVTGTAKITDGDFTASCSKHLAAIQVTAQTLSGRKYTLCKKADTAATFPDLTVLE